MSSEGGTSTFIIRWINFLTMLLAVGIVGFGVWMSSHHDSCRKSLTLPVIGLGAVIFIISIVGFLGALKNNSILLWIYLILLCIILVAILLFTVLAFIITNNGSGHNVEGLRYKEYQLQDYSSWFLKQLNNSHNWDELKSCLVKSHDCINLSRKYKNLKQYKLARLSPIEAGCCRPPSECGYPAVNASFYDLSFHPISSNKDCKLYKNSKAVKCYNCDSCKAGVAQYMKIEWRVVAIFNVILFVVLVSSLVYVGTHKKIGKEQESKKNKCATYCPRFTLLDAVLDEVLLGTTLKCERYKVHYFSPRRVTSPANVDKDCSFVRYHGNPDSSSQVWSSFIVKPRADIARVVFKTCTYHCLL